MTPPITATLGQTKSYAPPLWLDAQAAGPSDRPDLRDAYAVIEAQRRRIEELEDLATKDELTGLSNRRGLMTAFSLENERIARGQSPGAVLVLIDLNKFKEINDTFGHDAGDAALRALSTTLLGFIRTTDHVARLGGDEFVVLLPTLDDPLIAARVAAVLQANLADSYQVAEHILYATPSIGIGLYPDDGPDPSTLLRNADTAMYHAKDAGRNNHQFYTARMNAAAVDASPWWRPKVQWCTACVSPRRCRMSSVPSP